MAKPTEAEMQQLIEASMRTFEQMGQSRMCLTIFSKDYEKDPLALIQFAVAVLMDKPLFILIEKGRTIPANVRAVASGYEVFDPSSDADLDRAMKTLMTKAKRLM